MKRISQSRIFVLISLVLALMLAACGGGASATAIPTSTIIPTYSFLTPTSNAVIETAIATTAAQTEATAEITSGLDPEVVDRGKGRYVALQCGSCHGDNGEGTDKGSDLTKYTASEDDFITFMRSGGKIGPSHQYSTNRLSETGGKALYQYLLSLQNPS